MSLCDIRYNKDTDLLYFGSGGSNSIVLYKLDNN